jgi:hypothetical protein
MDKERIKELAGLAGFKYSHDGPDYVCFKSENTNIILVYTSTGELSLLRRLFKECRIAGQIKLRLEYEKLMNPFNYHLL